MHHIHEDLAFPSFAPSDGMTGTEISYGITIRDYFAAKAMQAWVTAAAFNQEAEDMMNKAGLPSNPDLREEFIANLSYSMAEAMLKAREEYK